MYSFKKWWLNKNDYQLIKGWWVNYTQLLAVQDKTIKTSFLKFHYKKLNVTPFGSWKFIATHKLNNDVLDTLRWEFLQPKLIERKTNG